MGRCRGFFIFCAKPRGALEQCYHFARRGCDLQTIWVLARVGLVLAAACGFAACSASEEQTPQQQESPSLKPAGSPCGAKAPSGYQLWRWGDVTVTVPDDPTVFVNPEDVSAEAKPPDGGLGLRMGRIDLSTSDAVWSFLVDAENGAVIFEEGTGAHEAEIQQVKATIAVCPFDASTAPWPYNGEPPTDVSREGWAGLTFLRPDPASGISVSFGIGSGGQYETATPAECEGPGQAIQVRNGRSSMGIRVDSKTGVLCKNLTNVRPEDVEAFERYLAEVKVCGDDKGC
jgi:hypothetical protein